MYNYLPLKILCIDHGSYTYLHVVVVVVVIATSLVAHTNGHQHGEQTQDLQQTHVE